MITMYYEQKGVKAGTKRITMYSEQRGVKLQQQQNIKWHSRIINLPKNKTEPGENRQKKREEKDSRERFTSVRMGT